MTLTLSIFLILGLVAFSIVSFAVWLYALVTALRHERLESTERLTWVLVILLANVLGALVYLAVAPNRTGRTDRELADLHRRPLSQR